MLGRGMSIATALAMAGMIGQYAIPSGIQRIVPGTKEHKRARAAYKHRNRSKAYPFSSAKQHSKMAKQYGVARNGFTFMNTYSTKTLCKMAKQEAHYAS